MQLTAALVRLSLFALAAATVGCESDDICPPGTVYLADREVCEIVAGTYSASDPQCPEYCPWSCWGNTEIRECDSLVSLVGGGRVCGLSTRGYVHCWGDSDANEPSATPAFVSASAVAVGGSVVCAIVDGDVFCSGQTPAPRQVNGIAHATQVSVGNNQSCALSDGQVSCWQNSGEDTALEIVENLANVTTLAAGGGETCAVMSGQVFCWPQLQQPPLRPARVLGIEGVSQISMGASHTCALHGAGLISCWGRNGAGQLGRGYVSDDEPFPQPVTLPSPASTISCGEHHTCALTEMGTLCWGANDQGQVGTPNSNVVVPEPARVPIADGARAIALARNTSCVVTQSGGAECWGSDELGLLGDGDDNAYTRVPRQEHSLQEVRDVAVSDYGTSCAKTDAGLWCWGANNQGELGSGSSSAPEGSPKRIPDIAPTLRTFALGNGFGCAVVEGRVTCWGNTVRAGIGAQVGISPPTEVPGVANVASLSRASHCGITTGNLICWGASGVASPELQGQGEVLAADAGCYVRGSQVFCHDGLSFEGDYAQINLTNITSISRGRDHACVVAAGRVHCWGSNTSGQLGQGTTERSMDPIRVPGFERTTALSSGAAHTCAVVSGQVYCWGSNSNGQVGSGNRASSVHSPERAQGLTDIVAISCGGSTSCAVSTAGELFCWGTARLDGSQPFRSTARPVRRPLDATDVQSE